MTRVSSAGATSAYTSPFSLPAPPAALVITADDFGFGVPTSRGIIAAHHAGVVTSTSLMTVTGDHAAASVALLAGASSLEVGLHAVFSGPPQKPLLAGRSSGLVDRAGSFLSLPRLLIRAWMRRLDRAAVYDELCAQAHRCRELLGRPPAHVDGHHHAHQLPIIRDAIAQAMQAGEMPRVTRLTVEPPAVRRFVRGSALRRSIMHRLGTSARETFTEADAFTNDNIFGMIEPARLADPNPWSAYLPHLPASGLVEWFVHPGEKDDSLIGRDTYLDERAQELEFFLKLARHPDWPKWKAALTTKSVHRRG